MRRIPCWCVVPLLAGIALCAGDSGRAQVPGISDERILFGQSAAFSGPARELGEHMRLGIEAAFREANERGGVDGRRLELVSLDDAYEPEAAIVNTRWLVAEGRRLRLDRRRWHADLAFRGPSRRGGGGSLHCAFYRRGLPARSTMEKRGELARFLRPGDRGNGRPTDR